MAIWHFHSQDEIRKIGTYVKHVYFSYRFSFFTFSLAKERPAIGRRQTKPHPEAAGVREPAAATLDLFGSRRQERLLGAMK
jgi:hypothetical protein